ncbi:MAG: phosphoglucosamine mutase [Planctomycetota bacterium]
MPEDALMIGVSGMRGTVGGTLTPAVVSRMAGAFAKWLWSRHDRPNDEPPKVVLGRDSRPSGVYVRDAAAATLVAAGIELIDLGIVSTPGVAMMVTYLEADAGIVATASHNPIVWNGLKFLDATGIAPPPDDVAEIRGFYDADDPPLVPVDRLVQPKSDPTTHAYHVKRVLDGRDILGISTKAYKVVLDSVNGAGCVTGATLLSKLGCRLVHLGDKPDGQFPHEPEPTEANLQGLCDEVRRQKAAVGFAQDPDADRLAIVDENGTYIGEEYTLALCARAILSKKKAGTIVANLSTSRMIDDVAARFGGTVIRTPVGEANVIQGIRRENAVLGGEGNGGVIDPRVVGGRDSLVAMTLVLTLLADTGMTLSELVADMPQYVIVKDKLPLAKKEDAEPVIDQVAERFSEEHINTSDGLRIDWPDGWLSVRASNTEPILRIICEAPDETSAHARIAEARKAAAI